MGRIVFWIVLAVAAYLVLRWWQRQKAGARVAAQRRAAVAGETMVTCAVCGLNVPRSEAVHDGEHAYCCEEHHQQSRGGS